MATIPQGEMGRDTSESDSDLSSCHRTSDFEDLHPRNRYHHAETKRYTCDFEGCGKKFYRPSKLDAHKHLHFGQRPFKCSFGDCNKAYTNSSHLKRHIRTSHEKTQQVNSFRCTEESCEAVLQTRQCLKKHIKRRHTDLPYECAECKAKFKRNHQLREHAFIHTGVHPYVCEKCKKVFVKSYDLKKHQRCHRTYTCRLQNCSVTFPSMSLYRKHMATVHKPEYQCAVCNKKFTTQSNLKAHFSIHFSESPGTWKCSNDKCESTFSQERYLKQHLDHVHGMWHEYKCPIENCEKVFKWKRSLFHHVKLHSLKKSQGSRKAQNRKASRKDKGEPKKSMAAELANVSLPPSVHKELITKNEKTLDSDYEIVLDIDQNIGEESSSSVLKSGDISLDCNKEINSVPEMISIGNENYYRIENVALDLVSDCSDFDEITI